MSKGLRRMPVPVFAAFFLLTVLCGCDSPRDPLTDRQKLAGEWLYNRIIYTDGSVRSYNGNIITVTASGGFVTVYTNESHMAYAFKEGTACYWITYYTNGNVESNFMTWSLKEADKLLTLVKVYYTNIFLSYTNIYLVYNYTHTYSFIDDYTLQISAENDSFTCIMDGNQPTNYLSNMDVFSAYGVSYAVIAKSSN